MALYEFKCKDCGHPIEVVAHMEDSDMIASLLPGHCPSCDGRNFRRVWSAPAIQFVGGGWGCKS